MNLFSLLFLLFLWTRRTIADCNGGSSDDNDSSDDNNNNEDNLTDDQLELKQIVIDFFTAYSEFFNGDTDNGVFDSGNFFSDDALTCDVGTGCIQGLDLIGDNSRPFQPFVDLSFFNFKFLGINSDLLLKPTTLSVNEFVLFPNGCNFVLTRIYIFYFDENNFITHFLAADTDTEAIKLFFTLGQLESCD